MHTPVNIQLIGTEVAIGWSDGVETYFQGDELRAASPSAENIGERDILGNQYGGDGPKRFPGITVTGWELVGNYACLLYTSPSPRDRQKSRMPSSA